MFNSSQNVHIHSSNLHQSSTTVNQLGVTRGFDILTKAVAPNAFHNSDDRADPPKCHENTRVAVINKIMGWVTGQIDTDAFFLWLYGPAGSGKSAIARSVAERCEGLGLLLASFFFFRTDSKRNSLEAFVASIAYCIALVVPSSRGIIDLVVETNPLIFQYSFEVQFTKLVLEPLQSLSDQGHFETTQLPPLIIIDGLDECLDEDSQTKAMEVLASSMRKSRLPFKFLVASRPEPQIKFVFQSLGPQFLISHLELNDDFSPDEDIRLFLVDKFDHIRRNHPFSAQIPISPWPGQAQLEDLVRKASGQFIYASLVVHFVDSPRHTPTRRLEIILELRPANRDLPFAELDKLYSHILSRVSDPPLVSQIFGVRFAMEDDIDNTRTIGVLEKILSLEEGDASTALADLNSLIQLQDEKIVFHHSSFTDFLRNRERSKDHYVDVPGSHATILRYVRRHGGDSKSWSAQRMVSGQGQALADVPKEVYNIDLATHLRGSRSTVDLRDEVKEFDLNAYMQQGSCHLKVWELALWVNRFLKHMKSTDLHDLHEHHSTVLDRFVNSDFQSCSDPEKLHLLSTVWFVLQSPLRSMAKHGPLQGELLWRALWSEGLEFDPTDQHGQSHYELLNFPTQFEYWRIHFRGIESLEVLYGTIEATTRCVPSRLLQDRLARLAAICKAYLHRCASGKERPTRKIIHARAVKSARSPWLFKNRTQQISYHRQQILVAAWGGRNWRPRATRQLPQSIRCVARLLFSTPQRARTLSKAAWTSYLWMLDFLRRLLLVARESSDLLDLLSNPLLPYSAQIIFPRRTRRINQAVERYLRRYSSTPSGCDCPEGSDNSVVENFCGPK